MSAQASFISWNVYTNHDVADVLRQLQGMILQHDPDVIALYEAKHLYGHLNHLGYHVRQLKSKTARKGLKPGAANVALLIKKNLPLRKTFTMRMTERWKGPHLGAAQSPRVYRWVKFEKGTTVWKVGGFHVPFGTAARKETFKAMRDWFAKTVTGRPTVALGDYNSGKATVVKEVAKSARAKVVGKGIDLATLLNCHLIRQEDLGHHGSDHPAMYYVLQEG